MRETYPITTETLNILDGHAKQIALEMDVDKSYLYQILSSVEADPFGKFRDYSQKPRPMGGQGANINERQ